MMSRTPKTDRKIAHAQFHLGRLRSENAKVINRDAAAIEADLTACLGAIQSARWRLEKEVGPRVYAETLGRWKGTLSPAERHRFKRMEQLRHLDVHLGDANEDLETSRKSTAVPHYGGLPENVIFAPVDAMVPNPDPDGSPKAAPAWVHGEKTVLEAADAAVTCANYLDLMKRLARNFR